MESLATALKGLLGPDAWSVLSFVYWQIVWPPLSQPSMHWVYLLSSLVHHSADPKHFDRNFGFLLSFWDRCAGTLYLPHPAEAFKPGLPPEAGRFDSAWNLLVQPFVASYRLLVPQRRRRKIENAAL